jgi:hypothetical protein
MRLISTAVAIAALLLTGGSAQAVATRVLPAARHDATPSRWRRMVEIRYLSGRTETGYVEWVGLGDSVDWATARYLNVFTLKPIRSRDMIGATVTYIGDSFPVR